MPAITVGKSYVGALERRARGWRISAWPCGSRALSRLRRANAAISEPFTVHPENARLPCGLAAYLHQGETFFEFVPNPAAWLDALRRRKPGFTDLSGKSGSVHCLILNYVEGKYDPMNS